MTFDDLKSDYASHLAEMKFTQETSAKVIATRLLKNRDRFLSLQTECGVPALWVMPVFERENPDFNAYLGNGDPLSKPTVHVPRGRGPFSSWEAGAADALKLDHVMLCPEWTWERACYEWELWNGFGPRSHGRTSGYLWSGTSEYHGGKYISDGVWSRGSWDHQIGCVIVSKVIAEMDEEIGKGFSPGK